MTRVHQLQTAEVPGSTSHPVHREPRPHIRRKARGPLKGWTPSHAPLPAPRLLLTPYLGCSAGCDFCFLQDFPGLYRLASHQEILTVYENYESYLEQQLTALRVAPPGYLAPFTDPFQPINDRYNLAEQTVKVFASVHLPLEIVTRFTVPDEVVAMMQYLPEARVQISIDPLNRSGEVPPLEERLDRGRWMEDLGLSVVPRLDPIVPGAADLEKRLKEVVEMVTRRGFEHLLLGFGRLSPALLERYGEAVREQYEPLDEGPWWLPSRRAQKSVLDILKEVCEQYKASMGVLGAPELQDEFGTYPNLFYKPLSIYSRHSEEDDFVPVQGCPGDCFRCPEAVCGISELRGVRRRESRLTARDWNGWGKSRLQGELLE